MPTGPRLVAALWFGVLAWYVSGLIMPLMPEGTQFGLFTVVNAAVGGVAGWKIIGTRVGFGYRSGMGAGLTASLAMTAAALFIHSFVIMIENSLDKRYKGPMEAVVDVFNLLIEHAQIMATGEIITVLAVGGLIGGILGEWASRRWA